MICVFYNEWTSGAPSSIWNDTGGATSGELQVTEHCRLLYNAAQLSERRMGNVSPILPLATNVVPEDQITISRVSALLDAAYIDHCLDGEGGIDVTDVAFPVWVTVDPQSKLLMVVTYFEPEIEATFDWLEKVNGLNAKIVLPQFCYRQGRLWGSYWLTYDGGLNVRHFVKMLRRFAEAFRLGVEDLQLCP
jgi:hypothetical protein